VVLNAERLYNYFASNFDLSKSTKGWYRFANPFKLSSEPTMAIHFDYNFVKCYKTGYKDHCMNFICQYEDITYREAVQLIGGYDELEFKDYTTFVKKQVVFKLPDHFRPLYSEGIFSKRLIAYLEGRGFDTRLLNNMGFGYCDDGDFMGFLIVPFTRKGKLVYYIGRDFLGRSMRYKNPKSEDLSLSKSDLFFNEDALDLYDEVYLVEGWSDAMTVGKDCVASLGWSLSPVQQSKLIKARLKRLTIIPDAGFYEKALVTAYTLYDYMDVYVANIDGISTKDNKDVNSLGWDKVKLEVEKAEKFTPKLLI